MPEATYSDPVYPVPTIVVRVDAYAGTVSLKRLTPWQKDSDSVRFHQKRLNKVLLEARDVPVTGE